MTLCDRGLPQSFSECHLTRQRGRCGGSEGEGEMEEKRGGDFGRSATSWETVANFLPQLRCPREKESGPTGFLCLSLTVRGWSGHKGCSRWGSQEIRGCEQGLLQEGAGGPRPPSAPGPLGRFQSTVGPP